MSESTGQPPFADDDAESSLKPRPVASRHFRQSTEMAPEGTTGSHTAGSVERPAGDDEAKVRRKPMPRSGNLNMSLVMGDAPAEAEESNRFHEVEPATFTLPEGFAALAWKLGAVAAVMFGVGYFAATFVRPSGPPLPETNVAPVAPAIWRPASLEILHQSAAADRAGDPKTAIALLTALMAREPNLPGLVRFLADLQVRQGNYIAADNLLLAQVNAGREVGASMYLRAFNAARQRHFDDATKYLQAAMAIDPLAADPYFQMAELLRRQGKWVDAIDYGRQALLRVRPGSGISPATIALKLRLAQIEAGQVAEVESALAAASKSTPLAAEWLFTAAALSLQKGNLTGAAEAFAQAREQMPREEFVAWIEDYFFRLHTGKPELVAFRPTDDERRQRQHASWEFSLDP